MPQIIRHKILGRVWDVVFTTRFVGTSRRNPTQGECDPPQKRGKQIRISSRARGRKVLELIIHESLHAAAWEMLDEDFVDTVAHDISKLLYREDVLARMGLEKRKG